MSDRRSVWQRVSAWADLVRLPNLPTVWSNMLVGLVLGVEAVRYAVWGTGVMPSGGAMMPTEFEQALRQDLGLLLWYWPVWLRLLLAFSLIYIGGMAMHDWCDAPRDAEAKPGRPIVAGRIDRQTAAAWAVLGMGLALVMMFSIVPWLGQVGLVLVALIVAYNLTHHRWAGSAVLLGLIRGWLIFSVAWCVVGSMSWRAAVATALPIAVVMAVYVTLVSVIARGEDEATAGGSRLGWWVLPVGLVSLLWVAPREPLAWGVAAGCGAMVAVWLIAAARRVSRGERGPATGMYLAGIALVDAYTLALLGRPGLSSVALGLFGLALGLQRWRAAGRAT